MIFSILKYKNYQKLYTAGSTSELGSFITETVLALFLYDLTNQNKSYLGLLRAIFLISITIGSLYGGSLSGRFNKKSILIFCNLVRIPGVLILLIIQKVWVVLFIEGFLAFFTGIFKPNRQSLINEILPTTQIKKANALFGSTSATIHLIGPFIGALVYNHFKRIEDILLFDLFTYFIGTALLWRIIYKAPPKETIPNSSWSNIKKGFTYVKNFPELKANFLNSAIVGLSIGILVPMIIPFTIEVLGKSEKEYGFIMACFGLGGLIGGSISNVLSLKYPVGKIAIISLIIEGLLYFLWVRTSIFSLSAIVIFLWGAFVFLRVTSQLNFVSETVPTKYLGQVYSLLELSFIAPNILGGIFIGVLGNEFSTQDLLKNMSWLFAVLILLRLFSKDLRLLWRSKNIQINRDIQTG